MKAQHPAPRALRCILAVAMIAVISSATSCSVLIEHPSSGTNASTFTQSGSGPLSVTFRVASNTNAMVNGVATPIAQAPPSFYTKTLNSMLPPLGLVRKSTSSANYTIYKASASSVSLVAADGSFADYLVSMSFDISPAAASSVDWSRERFVSLTSVI
jgi:hypothetical protein